ncbi:MAG: rRNA maturation RNase YbeY [Pseudomonadota bacterium]
MEHFDILIEDPRWDACDLEPLAQRAVTATLVHCGIVSMAVEISLLACDDARISALNAEFRGQDKPTNVLSWPSEERAAPEPGGQPRPLAAGPGELIALGDMAIAYDTCLREAQAAGQPMAAHVTHLVVHATLHLLGYDHETPQDAALMEGREVKILGKLSLDDPYRDI